MVTWSLIKELKPSNEKKTAFSTNGTGSPSQQHVEECKSIHSYLLVKVQFQVDQGLLHKTRYTEINRRESGEVPRTHDHSMAYF